MLRALSRLARPAAHIGDVEGIVVKEAHALKRDARLLLERAEMALL
jgi:hypothetical protein